ncbi:hypothetical protein IB232_21285 [Pseudomonas sp. PDM15]|uniref:hypothetical protein n=1 Tax=Pseudomonas sp. PDM15 TaxID=2769303 RepID=UPI00178424D4|nr:hypothetical protein [Pseudomonas sp. PDM15]MBD9427875.1 hypothetical protein [Pseudomonas sp. PDM15]
MPRPAFRVTLKKVDENSSKIAEPLWPEADHHERQLPADSVEKSALAGGSCSVSKNRMISVLPREIWSSSEAAFAQISMSAAQFRGQKLHWDFFNRIGH